MKGLPDATVVQWTPDGLPMFIVGEMAKPGVVPDDVNAAASMLKQTLPPILAPFRLTTDQLVATKMSVDDQGDHHIRYQQTHDGLPVIGGDLVVHVDVKGAIYSVNGTARGDIPASLGQHAISEAQALSAIPHDSRFTGMTAAAPTQVFIQTDDGSFHKAYETVVTGSRGLDPVRDKVYVDVDTGAIVADHPQIHMAESRKVYSSNNGTTTPGTLKRSEGQAATTDTDVNAAYDGTGDAYEAYKNFFNRDSYDNAGAQLISSVHYSTNYCNAYWDGTQMVYGDGDPSQGCAPLARAVDVTAHELTHAVTERESGLNYSGESGGMNEAMSDIFGAFVEAWTDGGKTGTLAVSNNTWLVGEDIISGGLRYMCNPHQDGASADVWSSTVGNLDVHYSSGVGNLAFCLLSKGGTHPTGKTTTVVPALGMDKAIRIMYKAQTDYITSTSKYAAIRTAMEQAALSLYGDTERNAVSCAWEAVKVTSTSTSCGSGGGGSGSGSGSGGGSGSGSGGGGGDGVLTNNVPVSGVSGATNNQKFWSIAVPAGQTSLRISISGGTGDADLYVQSGAKPTTTSYVCRPYLTGNAETCTISNPVAGTYWVMINGYAAYSGVTLLGAYSGGGGGGGTCDSTTTPCLTSGVAVTGVSGATNSQAFWHFTATAGHPATVVISGGTGDADLYVRQGAKPTTSTYTCRPYLTGNAETCTISAPVSGDYYVMLRGYAAFTGVSLKATY